jgi:hypothetical protein
MSYSRLGQITPQIQTTTQRVVYRQSPYAVQPVLYSPGVTFTRRLDTGMPGQMYPISMNPEEIEKAVYKDVPTSVKKAKEVTGTEPQKVVTIKSGLEVPAYIIQRDIARKQEAIRQQEAIANIPLPKFHKIGVFVTQKPAQALAAALILGFVSGHVFYGLRH